MGGLQMLGGAPPAGATYKAGDYIGPLAISGSAAATTAGTAYFSRIHIPKALTVDRIACWVRTLGAASTVRLGIYTDVTGRPGTLLVDGGTIDSTATGAKTVTIAQALAAGAYWLCGQVEGGTPQLDFTTNEIILAPKTDITATTTGSGFSYAHTGALAADVSAQTFTALGGGPRLYVRAA